MKNKNILVVGGAGFVGSNLVKTILERGPNEVVVVDNLLSSERANLPADAAITFIEGSITNDDILNNLNKDFDYVFHLATYHGNQNSIQNPLADHENNVLTTLKLYETIKDFPNLQKVVYSSAGCTVAEKTYQKAEATAEDAPVSLYMDSPYQISKIIGEYYSNYYFGRHGLPVVKARFQNVYGPGEVLGAGKWRGTPATVWRNVIPTFVYRALQGMPLIVENQGKASRDFIFVDDIVEGLMSCAKAGEAGEVYNLASGAETPIIELARLVNELTNNSASIEMGPERPWDSSGHRFGSTAKASKFLGFTAKTTLKAGLHRTIDWTKENLEFINNCIAKHHQFVDQLLPN